MVSEGVTEGSEIFEELGKLDEQTQNAIEGSANDTQAQAALEGFLVTVGRVLKQIFGF